MTQSFVFPQFKLYGFLIALGISFSYLYSLKNSKKFDIKTEIIDSVFLLGIFLALVGARLYYIFSSFSYYQKHPLEILFVWQGGLGIFGALLGAFTAVLIASKTKKINALSLLNLIFPPLLISQAIGRIGNYFNHESAGPRTNTLWGINIDGQIYHPTFFYESILCLISFLIFLKIPEKIRIRNGFSYYLINYGLIRLITEFFRTDTWLINDIHVGHLISITIMIVGIIIFIKTNIRKSILKLSTEKPLPGSNRKYS